MLDFPGKLLKLGAVPLTQYLTDLVNLSIKKRIFPDPLKLAEVSPQFKKDDELSKCNYRLVSILTIISKIIERCYSDQLSSYFDNIFSPYLSAYRKKYGCQSALLRMIESWRESLDNGVMVGVLAMDLSRAFDSVPHP